MYNACKKRNLPGTIPQTRPICFYDNFLMRDCYFYDKQLHRDSMIRCTKCNKVHAISKSGIVRGKQRYYCKDCQINFTLPDKKQEAHDPQQKKHMATIVDIARALNISKSTVSRALHEHSDINKETRLAVLKMATKLDYQPNLLAKSLVQSTFAFDISVSYDSCDWQMTTLYPSFAATSCAPMITVGKK